MILKPQYVNHMICSDFTGPFKVTKNGNRYLQVIACMFSKFAILVAHPSKETLNAAKGIVHGWCCHYGIPEKLLTDGGKEYQSELMHAMMELLDVERLKTTIFHPECDGQSERDIQTFKKMITAYINEEQSNWDQHIEVLAYAFNSSVHASTGYTPFEAMTGRQPKLPIDLLYPTVNLDIQEGTSESQVEKLPETQPTMKEKFTSP